MQLGDFTQFYIGTKGTPGYVEGVVFNRQVHIGTVMPVGDSSRFYPGLFSGDKFLPGSFDGNRLVPGMILGDDFVPGIATFDDSGWQRERDFLPGIFHDGKFVAGIFNDGKFHPGDYSASYSGSLLDAGGLPFDRRREELGSARSTWERVVDQGVRGGAVGGFVGGFLGGLTRVLGGSEIVLTAPS